MDIRKATRPRLASGTPAGTASPSVITGGAGNDPIPTPNYNSDVTPPAGKVTTTNESFDAPTDDVIKTHRLYLEDKGIDDTIIMSVLDMIISESQVLWQFDLLGKIPVSYRIRPQWVDRYLIEELEKYKPSNVARFSEIVSSINLAGALNAYGKDKFILDNADDLARTMAYLSKLPFVIQNKLVDELAIFDRVVVVATSEWAVKNFTAPR